MPRMTHCISPASLVASSQAAAASQAQPGPPDLIKAVNVFAHALNAATPACPCSLPLDESALPNIDELYDTFDPNALSVRRIRGGVCLRDADIVFNEEMYEHLKLCVHLCIGRRPSSGGGALRRAQGWGAEVEARLQQRAH